MLDEHTDTRGPGHAHPDSRRGTGDTQIVGHVALSRFDGRRGWVDTVVDDVAGFVRLDVLRPRNNPREFWQLTITIDSARGRGSSFAVTPPRVQAANETREV